MLLTILLDAGTRHDRHRDLIALIGGAVNPSNQLEFATYIFLGGMAGDRSRSGAATGSRSSSRPAC